MKKSPRERWTLAKNGITVEAGTLIEFQFRQSQTRIARVELVRTIEAHPPYSEAQVIHAKIYGPMKKHDGRRTVWIQPEEVIRVLEKAPPPPAKELASLWSPRDDQNPFRVEQALTNEEWKGIARWYEFSVRVLMQGITIWHEQARTRSWDVAKQMIHTQGSKNLDRSWVVMKCELRGKEGREKPVMWYPSESGVRTTLHQVGLFPKADHERSMRNWTTGCVIR